MSSQITEDKVRKIVGQEIDTSKVIAEIKDDISEIKDEQRKQGVLLEDLHTKFDKNINLLNAEMKVKKQVGDHEERLGGLETGQRLLKSTVKLHSQQLGAK